MCKAMYKCGIDVACAIQQPSESKRQVEMATRSGEFEAPLQLGLLADCAFCFEHSLVLAKRRSAPVPMSICAYCSGMLDRQTS